MFLHSKIINERLNKTYFSVDNEKIKIINYIKTTNLSIQFENGIIKHNVQYNQLLIGKVQNPNKRTICNIGYNPGGKYLPSKNRILNKNYQIFCDMIKRCYDKNLQNNFNHESYIGCTVDERWHNFQVFAEWFEQNYIDGFVLDKDILVKGNKVYGPDTCCFVPNKINGLFIKKDKARGNLPIGVFFRDNKFTSSVNINNIQTHLGSFNTCDEAFKAYKINKEKYIREITEIWKDKITEKVYQALINYQVEITD